MAGDVRHNAIWLWETFYFSEIPYNCSANPAENSTYLVAGSGSFSRSIGSQVALLCLPGTYASSSTTVTCLYVNDTYSAWSGCGTICLRALSPIACVERIYSSSRHSNYKHPIGTLSTVRHGISTRSPLSIVARHCLKKTKSSDWGHAEISCPIAKFLTLNPDTKCRLPLII